MAKRRSKSSQPVAAKEFPEPVRDLVLSEPPIPEKHIEAVLALLIIGQRDFEIRQFIQENFPDVDAARLLILVAQKLADDGDIDSQLVRGWSFNAMRHVFKMSLETGELNTALRAADRILKTFG